MKPAAKIIGKVRRGVEKVAYGNPIYQRILASGSTPDRLYFTPPDLWPGDAEAGMAMMAAQRNMFDMGVAARQNGMADDLRNLRAVGTDAARRMAVSVVTSSMERCASWNDSDWEPHLLGERIAALCGFYEFYVPAAEADFAAKLAESLQRQWKHLLRSVPSTPSGIIGMDVVRGLVFGALNFSEGEDAATSSAPSALGHACDLLCRQISFEVLPDGAHKSRNPAMQYHVLRRLLDIRCMFRAADLPFPEEASMAIASMAPVLKFYRHADGGLALFHGGGEENALSMDAVLTEAEVKGRMPRRLTHGGFERLTAGRSLLIADCARPPEEGHAGVFAFEFAQGKERILVNCGPAPNKDWVVAMASTAAHNSLVLDDTNTCEVLPSGGIKPHLQCTAQRYEQEGAAGVQGQDQGLEMRHDGYVANYQTMHQRILELSGDGEVLRGRDVMEGPAGHNFTLRWHLHPAIQVSLAQSGQAALLRTPSGAGWRLRIESGELGLEPSIYCGTGTPRRTMQLKAYGVTSAPQSVVGWSLTREKK